MGELIWSACALCDISTDELLLLGRRLLRLTVLPLPSCWRFSTQQKDELYICLKYHRYTTKSCCYYQRYLAMLGVLILLIISYEAGTIYGKEQCVRVSCHIYYVTNLKENKHNEPAVWPCASPPHKRLQSFLFSLFSDLSSPRPKKFNIWVVGRAKSTAEAVFTS